MARAGFVKVGTTMRRLKVITVHGGGRKHTVKAAWVNAAGTRKQWWPPHS